MEQNNPFQQPAWGQPQQPQQGGFSQPGQFGQPQQQQPAWGQQPQQQPQGSSDPFDSVFGFKKTDEQALAEAGNRVDLEPGIFIWPVDHVTRFNTQSGNVGVRVNFNTGQKKGDGTPVFMDQTYYILDKDTGCTTFHSGQVERMRDEVLTTFGVALKNVMPPIRSIADIHVIDQFIHNLNQALAGKSCCVSVNWPKEVNRNGDAYLEVMYLNPLTDEAYLRKKFTARIKPGTAGAAGSAQIPGAPSAFKAPAVNLPQGNPTAAPAGQPWQQPAQQPQGNFQSPQHAPAATTPPAGYTAAPTAGTPAGNFQASPNGQGAPTQPWQQPASAPTAPAFGQQPPQTAPGAAPQNPYGAPAQPQAPIQQAPSPATTAGTFTPQQTAAPTAAPAPTGSYVEAGAGAPAGIDPASIPHKAQHPQAPQLQWNAEARQFMYLHANPDGTDRWDLLPF